ncbi:hypothetical protein THAOC_23067 [Thalassiosira oceanica]|uniref:Uncharacterized protein n=1 Tax=Thalassiosira oceanica TaxID=159749 RepID=K0RWU9_THAOC|nr:hypothetical protein THAOC_23067 [Thalassiosira oceanica]|eukprot:EJK56944.1 hypothetical protein THAOC_23067 [Thalassiosira oceanica]
MNNRMSMNSFLPPKSDKKVELSVEERPPTKKRGDRAPYKGGLVQAAPKKCLRGPAAVAPSVDVGEGGTWLVAVSPTVQETPSASMASIDLYQDQLAGSQMGVPSHLRKARGTPSKQGGDEPRLNLMGVEWRQCWAHPGRARGE